MVSKKELKEKLGKYEEEINELKQRVGMFTMSLAQIGLDKRDMYMGPNEFVLSTNNTIWKDVKISLAGEDITDTVTKMIILGPKIISE